jgi:hypothetical protein
MPSLQLRRRLLQLHREVTVVQQGQQRSRDSQRARAKECQLWLSIPHHRHAVSSLCCRKQQRLQQPRSHLNRLNPLAVPRPSVVQHASNGDKPWTLRWQSTIREAPMCFARSHEAEPLLAANGSTSSSVTTHDLVATGFSQKPGIEYEELYAAVAKHATVRAHNMLTALHSRALR